MQGVRLEVQGLPRVTQLRVARDLSSGLLTSKLSCTMALTSRMVNNQIKLANRQSPWAFCLKWRIYCLF